MRVVLWDVDGTLVLNSGVAGTFYTDAIREVAGVGPAPGDRAPAVEHGKTDAQIVAERLDRWGGDPALAEAVAQRIDELSDAYLTDAARRTAAPGVVPALRAVADAGWTNGLLTGNSRRRAWVKTVGAGIDPDLFDWDRSWFGDRTVRRADLTWAARDSLGTAVILGDTPADGAAAHAVGFPFVAVATGAYGEEQLGTTNAVLVVPDLERGLDRLLAVLATIGDESAPRDRRGARGHPEPVRRSGPGAPPRPQPGTAS